MCLIINRGTKVQVSKHDITVYKLICKEGSVLSSIYPNGQYKIDKI